MKMDPNEERKKKLEAGKEKLAAFRKKKAKRKKPETTQNAKTQQEPNSEEYHQQNGGGLSPPEVSSPSEIWSVTDSDQFSFTSGDEWSAEETDQNTSIYYQAKLVDAKRKIAELEEVVEGKQLALDTAVSQIEAAKRNDPQERQEDLINSNSWKEGNSQKCDVESALAHRDDLITQLMRSLQSSKAQNIPSDDVMTKIHALAQHISNLQSQLLQADQTLQEQLILHESSAVALQAAKAQMLQLQYIVNHKDQELRNTTQQIQEYAQTVHYLQQQIPQMKSSSEKSETVKLSLYEDRIKSLEDELKTKLAECENLIQKQEKWTSREEELLSSLGVKNTEISALLQSQETLKVEKNQLGLTCEMLQAQVRENVSDISDEEKVKYLEFQLEELRLAHESDTNEIVMLKRKIMELEETSDHTKCLSSSYESLRAEYDALLSKHSEELSQLEHLKSVNSDLQEKLQTQNVAEEELAVLKVEMENLSKVYQEEIKKRTQMDEMFSDIEAKFSGEKDLLNNRINGLQNELATVEANLTDAHDGETNVVKQLQFELKERNDELKSKVQELSEMLSAFETLQSNYSNLKTDLKCSEELVADLTQKLQTAENSAQNSIDERLRLEQKVQELQAVLEERESECKKYADKITELQDQILSDQHVHGVEISETEYCAERMEEQIEEMDSETKKCAQNIKELDYQLNLEKQEKEQIRISVLDLESKLDDLTSERNSLLQSVDSLTAVIRSLKEDLQNKSVEQCDVKTDVPTATDEEREASAKLQAVENIEVAETVMLQSGDNKGQTLQSEEMHTKLEDLQANVNEQNFEWESHQKLFQNEIEGLKATLNDTRGELTKAKESLQLAENELINCRKEHSEQCDSFNMKIEELEKQTKESECLQAEVSELKGIQQQLSEKEQAQEALQTQLETTISQWQRLQLIVQEKEIEVQNLQEDLEEQKRICSTLKKNENEERELLQSEIDSLKAVTGQQNEKIENELLDLKNNLERNVTELSGTKSLLCEREIELNSLKEDSILKESEISDLKHMLMERKSETVALQAVLATKEEEVTFHKNHSAEKETLVASLEKKIEIVVAEAESLKRRISENETITDELERKLEESQQEKENLKTVLSEKEAGMENLERQLAETYTEVKDLKTALSERESAMDNLERKLTDGQSEVEHLKISQSTFTDLENTIREQTLEITNLKTTLADTESHVETLKTEVIDKALQIDSYQSSADEKDGELLMVRTTLEKSVLKTDELEKDLSDTKSEIEELRILCGEKEKENTSLEKSLTEKQLEIDDLKNAVKEKEDEVDALKSRFEEKESEINGLVSSAKDQELTNTQLKQILEEKESHVVALSSELEAKDKEIVVLKKDLTDRESEVKTCVTDKESEITDLKKCITDKDSEIGKLKGSLADEESNILDLRNNLTEKESEVVELKNSVTEKESEIVKLQNYITNKESEIAGLKACLTDKESEVAESMSSFASKECEIQEVMKKLEEKEIETRALLDDLMNKKMSIEALESSVNQGISQIESMSISLAEKDSEIEEWKKIISERDEKVAGMKKILGEKESDIDDLKKKLVMKDSEIDSCKSIIEESDDVKKRLMDFDMENRDLKKDLLEKESEIDSFRKTLSEKEVELENLKASIQEHEISIKDLQCSLCEKEAENAELKSRVDETESEMDAVRSNLSDKEVENSNFKERLEERESKVVELEGMLESKERESSALKNSLERKEGELSDLKVFGEEVESVSEELKNKLEDKESQITSLSSTVVEMESEITTLRNGLAEKETDTSKKMSELENNVVELSSTLETSKISEEKLKAEHSEIILEREILSQSLVEMKVLVAENETQVSELTQKLADGETFSAEMLQKLRDSEKTNDSLKSMLSSLTSEMQAKDAELVNQKLLIEDQIAQISALMDSSQVNSASLTEMKALNVSLQDQNETLTAQSTAFLKDTGQQRKVLEQQVGEMENSLTQKEQQMSSMMEELTNEKAACQHLSETVKNLEANYQSLQGLLSCVSAEMSSKDGILIEQQLEIDNQMVKISELCVTVDQTNVSLKEMSDMNLVLKEESEKLTAQCMSLEEERKGLDQKLSKLQSDLEHQELLTTQYMVESKQLNEKAMQLTQTVEEQKSTIFDLKQDCEMQIQDISSLKHELAQKDVANTSLRQEFESVTSSLIKSREEKEMLKSNFDACMEDMQQRLGDQEMEVKILRCQLAEETKNVHHGQDQLKEIFEHQMSQLEEKLLCSEKQCENLEKELTESKMKSASAREMYEHQLADMELNLQSSSSEMVKLKEHISKVTNNHECEIAGLKRLHEIQTSELEDSCVALERTVAEQKRNISELTAKFHKEKNDLEHSFEIQVSDTDEKKRFADMEISRLKRHLEEMKHDHEKDLQNLEKSYEARLYELEDKCCVTTNELERLRKSLMSAEGGFSEERQNCMVRMEELETLRRDLEIKTAIQEDEIAMLKEQSSKREEEMKSVLKDAALKQQEKTYEMSEVISQLREQVSELTSQQDQLTSRLTKEYEGQLSDLQSRNKQLEFKSRSLEMHIEQDLELSKGESESSTEYKELLAKVANLQTQIVTLSEENYALKRRLLAQKTPERTLRLNSGVEAICPPYYQSFASSNISQSVDGDNEDCFSPAVEEEPILEGFFAEDSLKHKSVPSVSQHDGSSSSGLNQEPDFVEEQRDGFQPEIVHERVIDSSGQLNIHPICEKEICEGFQPETTDLFLMETIEEPGQAMIWPDELSVGMSPSLKQQGQQFEFNIPGKSHGTESPEKNNFRSSQTEATNLNSNCNSNDAVSGQNPENSSEAVFDKRLNDLKDELEEEYVTKMRRQEVELTHQFESQKEEYKQEMDHHFAQRVKATRYEWERKFTKALQKVKREMERRHLKELRAVRHSRHPKLVKGPGHQDAVDPATSEQDPMPDIAESEELGDVMEKLHRENQELAEVRDVLLRQIEFSQARGLHTRVQHELQTMMIDRASVSSHSSEATTPTQLTASPTMEAEENIDHSGNRLLETSVDDADSARSEVSETSSARERFLEELEEISHQSSQDLPLEWELTTTLGETGDFEQEPEHRSVWEVFDGRCVRQDCQELDTLRIQYEHQLSSLQRQLEAERRNNQEQMDERQQEYAQLSSDLRTKLDQEQQQKLDQVISELTQVHAKEIQRLEASHQHDVSLELTALKLSLEQIYASKSELEVSDVKLRYEQKMEALNKQHREEANKEMTGRSGSDDSPVSLNTSLMEQYNTLIQRISQELDEKFPTEQSNDSEVISEMGQSAENQVSKVPSLEIRNLLLTQQEEITSLRSKLLTEYESVLQSRTEVMQEQTQEVSGLEEQMHELQKQYEEQVTAFQEQILKREDKQKQEAVELRKNLEDHQEELKSYYEKKVQDMEASFEKEINTIKEKYENQISSLIEARLTGASNEASRETSQEKDGNTPQDYQHREYIHKTMALTAISDTDSDSVDTPRSLQTDISVRLKELESELAERDVQLRELTIKLEGEKNQSSSVDGELSDLRQQVDDAQKQASDALRECSRLQNLLEEKDSAIRQLEVEKGESEKLYRDLLEKESPRSKGSINKDHFSGSSVDDSFCSARDDVQDTPRSGLSDNGDFRSPRSDAPGVEHRNDNAEDLLDSIPFAKDSAEFSQSNNNNNSSALEDVIERLKRKVEELDEQLAAAREREIKLRKQMEEEEFSHKENIETLKQELEHERKVEVETLQSEFKIQMEIELKRQAAELLQTSTAETPPSTDHPTEPESGVDNTAVTVTQLVEDTDNPTSANNNALSNEEAEEEVSRPASESSSISEHLEVDMVDESHDPLLATSGFDMQQTIMDAGNSVMADTANEENIFTENMSDDSKANTSASALSSPTHVSAPLQLEPGQNLPLTDIEKEMEAMKEDYELQLAELREEWKRAVEEKDGMYVNHQREMETIHQRLMEAEERYDRLMEGVQSGEHPQLNQLMKDKYDEELELAKSLMQKDFDETIKAEKKKFVEKHRKLMTDFMGDRGKEEEELKGQHEKELNELKETLVKEFEEKLQAYEQEIERLNRDLDLLRGDMSEQGDEADIKDTTLPEIDEITLSFQEHEEGLSKSASPCSEDDRETSTPVKRPKSHEMGSQYEESEEETDAERAPTRQVRTFAEVLKSPSPSHSEKEEMERKIKQLVSQVERLTQQLAEKQDESSSPQKSPQHSPHNDTLKGDDASLIAMLQSDLDRISAERENTHRTNDRLLSLLSDSVKTYVGVEDTINRRLSQVVSSNPRASAAGQGDGSSSQGSRPSSEEPVVRPDSQARMNSPASDRYDRKGATPDGDTSLDSHTLENTSILSNATDEGLEISHRLAESIFVGPDLDAEGEEILTDARSRLTTAVGQLLELMERSTVQLIEAKATQQELLDTLALRAREMETSSSKCTELDAQLAAEIEAKEYLGLELHKAEGLIAGYSSERESLESQIQTLEEQREALIIELDTTRSRLSDFQNSQSEMDSTREELSRQQTLLRENAGQEMQADEQQTPSSPADNPPALLGEVSSLNQEKRELASQLQRQLDLSRKRQAELEALAEESERQHEAVLEEKNQAVEDMRLQLDNIERQLKASKGFVDEQMAEREQEREEHQKEIERLQDMLNGKDRSANAQQRLQREISDLTEQLQSRIASQSAMHQRTVDLQRALEDKELNSHDLKTWVAQLESELDQRGSVEEQLKQRITKLERQLTEKSEDEDTEVEEAVSSATERKDRNSPTVLSPARKPQRLSLISLEEEVQMTRQVDEELQHENKALKEQVQQQLLQISGLKNQLDQLRTNGGDQEDTDAAQLRVKLQAERDAVEHLESKLNNADNKIESLEQILKSKEEESEVIRQKVSKILDMGDAQEENENLKSQLEDLQSQISHMSSVSSMQTLPPELLEEKNHEIEELKQKLGHAEEEVSKLSDEHTLQKDKICQLQTRLKERDEEISDLQDNIASLHRGEPCLDVSLPLNEDAGNILNISMTGRTTRSARAVTPTSIQQEFEETMVEREGELSSLREQLEQAKRDLEIREQELKTLKDTVDCLNREKQDIQADNEKNVTSLEESIQKKDNEIYELTLGIDECKQQVEEKDAELSQAVDERDKSQEQLHEKEHRLDQMILQIDSLHHEISSLTSFQNELQKDFDTVQSMLDEKEKDIESLTKELTDSKSQAETLETVLQLERLVASLQKDLREKQNVVDEKEEELYELHDKLEEMGNVKEELDSVKALLAEKSNELLKEEKARQELEGFLAEAKASVEQLSKGSEDGGKISALEKSNEEKDSQIKNLETRIESLDKDLQELKSLETTLEEKEEFIQNREKLIESLKQNLEELKTTSDTEAKSMKEQMDQTKENCEKRIHDIEGQLQIQDANYMALQVDLDKTKSLEKEVESLKLQAEEKDAVFATHQEQLKEMETMIQNLKAEKETKEKELEEFSHMKRQLEETEEQLRLRQSALLDMQADKQQMALDMEELGELKRQLEEKDQNIEELEGQLRFRQSCILDMEAEKERVLEERDDLEVDLRKELEDKDTELEELQKKYNDLKAGIGEEVLHMEQEMQRSSQARVIKKSPETETEDESEELQRKLLQASDELVDRSAKQKQTEERLAQTSQQLMEREDQIQQLQAEIQNLQVESSQPQVLSIELEMKVEDLERELREAEERADAQTVSLIDSKKVIDKLEKELTELKKKETNDQWEELRSSRSVNLSASLPMEGMSMEERGMSRWESEPVGLALGNRDSVYLRFRMTEVERLSRQQQKELADKNQELGRLRADLERWLNMGKGQDSLQLVIKEKESLIVTLTSEIEMIKSQLLEREQAIASLRGEINSLKNYHTEEISSKDHTIAELQEEIYILKSSTKADASSSSSVSDSKGESLSPETKQSISHLKTQLRKAHAALEEMQQGGGGEFGAGDANTLHKSRLEQELLDLKQKLKEREEELSLLRSKGDGNNLDLVQKLKHIREELTTDHQKHVEDIHSLHKKEIEVKAMELNAQHDQDLRQLRQLQERKLQQALHDQKQELEKHHKTEVNEMRLKHQKELQVLREERLEQIGREQKHFDEESISSSISGEDGMPERLQALLRHLNQLGEHLLSVSDFHYLQQHLVPARDGARSPDTHAWGGERRELMDTIEALKDLLQERDKISQQSEDETGDWRGDLLQALVTVYEKEKRVLHAEVMTSNSLYPEIDIITQLESRIHDLEQVHQSSLDEMLRADRQSLIDEVDSLHHRLLEARSQLQDARDQLNHRIAKLEEAKSSAEWKLQRQIQMLEYKLQQEGVVQEDLKKSLKVERQRVNELSAQSNQERSRTLELQSELSSTQIHLSKIRDALEREQQRFSSVTDALEEERAKTTRLSELLESAKRKLHSLQDDVTQADSRNQQRAESEEGYIKELQSQLKKERQKSVQFSNAEEEAKREIVQLSDQNGILQRKLSVLRDEYEAKIETLHREQMELELQHRLEGESEAVSKLTELLDAERDHHQATLQQEHNVIKQLKRDIDTIRSENGQLRQHYETEKSRADVLKSDLDRSQSELRERKTRIETKEREEESSSHKHLKMVEKDREELRLKVNDLEEELSRVQERTRELEMQLASARSRTNNEQQTRQNGDFHREAINTLITASVVDQELKLRLAQCCSKLQTVARQLHGMTAASQQQQQQQEGVSRQTEEQDDEALMAVMTELSQLKAQIREKEQASKNGEPSKEEQVTELVQHNQQLAERIVRLKEEKEQLSDALSVLEARLQSTVTRDKHAQVNLPQYSSDTASEEDVVYDRTVWASERLSLQMALDSAEHEIQRLRTEIKQFRGLMNSEGQVAKIDPEKSQRLYGKFLRAESFRKALIYQKKYLLLLLGGYRDTEQETLAILASMGGFPSPHVGLYTKRIHTRAFTVFRSAGRVVIAIFRMKYLVKKWKRATRVGSPVMTGQITTQHAYVPSSSSYQSHQRRYQQSHHPQPSSSSNTYTTRSTSSFDYIDSLSNGEVSTLASNAYAGPTTTSRPHNYTTPPTKDLARQHKTAPRGNRDDARRRLLQDDETANLRRPNSARSRHTDSEDDNFLHYLENVQQQLSEGEHSSPSSNRRVAWR